MLVTAQRWRLRPIYVDEAAVNWRGAFHVRLLTSRVFALPGVFRCANPHKFLYRGVQLHLRSPRGFACRSTVDSRLTAMVRDDYAFA